MGWLNSWWHYDVVDGYKGPLLFGFVAFVVTFVVTRTITRLIRDGKGPFHNISGGGVHIHHSVPGVVLLIVGGFTALGSPPLSVWTYVAGLLVGVGASLVLDEFAMIFHLEDVYWSNEGQLSVDMVTLASACIGLAAVGVSPLNVDGLTGVIAIARGVAMLLLLIHLGLVAVTALKGKYPTAMIGIFIAPVAWWSAARLARPTSPWARWRYSEEKLARARERALVFDRRWGPVRRRWLDAIGGTPTPELSHAPTESRTR
ncbi:hypothetical protein [Mycobacterium sp. D16Q16]|uniref:hypothetical protein n=1 Tax=Mycobacterium sp. D16Q16 TaxID=1855659 RepID=UPI0009930030|nr:hypothetical protein [Mycobacterium sp. D16Q16]